MPRSETARGRQRTAGDEQARYIHTEHDMCSAGSWVRWLLALPTTKLATKQIRRTTHLTPVTKRLGKHWNSERTDEPANEDQIGLYRFAQLVIKLYVDRRVDRQHGESHKYTMCCVNISTCAYPIRNPSHMICSSIAHL